MLTKKTESAKTWYPVPIQRLEKFLGKVVQPVPKYGHAVALRKNIAYSLQHLEFLHRCIEDIRLSSVLETQTQKTFVMVGCGVVEGLLTYLLTIAGLNSTTDWQCNAVINSNEKEVDGVKMKVETHLFIKLAVPVPQEMTFDAMLKKAESKKVFGPNHDIYAKLKGLRKLRNRVHLQACDHPSDTDWNAFSKRDMVKMAEVLIAILLNPLFNPSTEENAYFRYLTTISI